MGIFDRILLTLYAAFNGLLAVLGVFVLGGWTTPIRLLELAFKNPQWRWGLLLVVVALFLASVRLVIVSLHKKVVPKNVVQENPLGQVHISTEAIENMVIKIARQINGIHEVKPRVVIGPDGVRVAVRVNLFSEVRIPEVSRQLQDKVQEYLTESAGISLQEVKVLVNNITGETRLKSRVE